VAAGEPAVHAGARWRVEAGGGLVEEQQIGLVEPGAGESQPLFEAAREAARQAASAVGKLHLGEDLGDALLCRFDAIEAGVEGEVLLDGEFVIEKGRFSSTVSSS
jgi:hypothetical protein